MKLRGNAAPGAISTIESGPTISFTNKTYANVFKAMDDFKLYMAMILTINLRMT